MFEGEQSAEAPAEENGTVLTPEPEEGATGGGGTGGSQEPTPTE